MNDNVSSFLKHKAKKELIEPMYSNINLLSSVYRSNNFKLEMDLLTTLFETFELFIKDLEEKEWDKKKVSKKITKKLNSIITQLNHRAKIRRKEFGI